MIDNYNASKTASSSEEYVDIKKYIGVASVNVVAINPDNAKLRRFGWTIPENVDEPKYVTTDDSGKKSARVRFLVQVQDFDDKPIVAIDFWVRPEVKFNSDATKAQIIDSFGRTAWGTKQELQAHAIPQYANGTASISSDYKPCHVGEEELVLFLMKYLNVTPLRMFSRIKNDYVENKNPGHLTIDHWDRLCNGDVREIAEYIALQPENRVKVVFGVRTTDENKTYQTFLPTTYIGNGAPADRNTGEYASARKGIDKFLESQEYRRSHGYNVQNVEFSAFPVKEWGVSVTEVKDNTEEDLPAFDSPEYTRTDVDDLPFADM